MFDVFTRPCLLCLSAFDCLGDIEVPSLQELSSFFVFPILNLSGPSDGFSGTAQDRTGQEMEGEDGEEGIGGLIWPVI